MSNRLSRLADAAFIWLGYAGDFSRLTFDRDAVPWVAVVIMRTSPCITHAGLAYRVDKGGPLKMVHLGGHRSFRDDNAQGECVYTVPGFKEENEEWIAGFCRLIASANGKRSIPYAFSWNPAITFDRATGRIGTIDSGGGLSCATFVDAVFRSARKPLTDPASWPDEADAAGIRTRGAILGEWVASGRPDLIARAAEIGPTIRTRRVRPEQVAGACLQCRRPAKYQRCHEDGETIISQLDTRYPPP